MAFVTPKSIQAVLYKSEMTEISTYENISSYNGRIAISVKLNTK